MVYNRSPIQGADGGMNRVYDWKNVPADISKYRGFVYCITNLKTDQYYIGKKFFHSMLTRKPLKGRKNKRHELVESNWQDYWGSCRRLQEDIQKYGKDNFKREILICCESKFELAYQEAKIQFEMEVLFDPLSYNELINIRLRKRKAKK